MTGIWLQAWQQWTGINFIFYYGTTYFQQSGISNAFVITIATNVVNVGATIPGIYLVEKAGRRRLLIWGAVVMCLCEYIIAIVGVTTSTDNLASQRVLIAFVCVYIAAFACTWGPGAWVVISEIFPLSIRAKAMSMSTASNWFWNCIIGVITPYLVDDGYAALHSKVFFIWGTTCLGCIIFAFFCVYETKGHSLEEVDLLYESRIKAWHSRGWKPSVKDYWANEERKASQAQIEDLPVGDHSSVADTMASGAPQTTTQANKEAVSAV